MNLKLKNPLVISCFFAVFFLKVLPAPGYVLQGRHVLDLMVARLGTAKSLYVAEKMILYRMADTSDDQAPAVTSDSQLSTNASTEEITAAQQIESNQKAQLIETLEFEGNLRYLFSRAFRSDARSSSSEIILVAVGGRTLTIIDGNIVPDRSNRFNLYKDVLLYRSREVLADRLLQLGVDVSLSSLGRFEDKIAFVIGANYPGETANQLWVDKDTLLPLRLILKGAYGTKFSDTVEVRYLIWWKIGKTHYPSRIEFYQGDNLVRVNQAQNCEENATFSEALFDIDQLEATYPQAPVHPAVPGANEEPSEIQKTIEEFKRIFE